MKRLLLLLLLLPIAFSSKVMIYSARLNNACYGGVAIENLRDFLQSSGYTVEFGSLVTENKLDEGAFDAVILLSCTRELTTNETADLMTFVENGGGLMVDALDGDANVLNVLNISKGIQIAGNKRGYRNTFGLIDGEEISYYEQNEITKRGKNTLVYNGPTLLFRSNFRPLFWNSVPNEVVAGYAEQGNGRIIASGSLFSFNDNLFLDMVDWVLNETSFPKVEVTRQLSAENVSSGDDVLDTITVAVFGGKASLVIQLLPVEGLVKLEEQSSVPEATSNLVQMAVRWNVTTNENKTIVVPRAKIIAQQGSKMRIFYGESVNLTVSSASAGASAAPTSSLPQNDQLSLYVLVFAGLLIVVGLVSILTRKKEIVTVPSAPVSREPTKEDLLKEKEDIEKQMRIAKIKFMKHEIDSAMYNNIVQKLQERLIEINVKLGNN